MGAVCSALMMPGASAQSINLSIVKEIVVIFDPGGEIGVKALTGQGWKNGRNGDHWK